MAGLEIEIGPAKKPMFGGKGHGMGGSAGPDEEAEGDDGLGDSLSERVLEAIDSHDAAGLRSALEALVLDITSSTNIEE